MDVREPLGRFPAIRTHDPDELRERMAPLYSIRSLEAARSKLKFAASINLRQLENIGLGFARYTAPVRAVMSNTDFYAQGFGHRGHGEVEFDGRIYKVADKEGGAGGPGATANLRYEAGMEHIFTKIAPDAVHRKLSAMIGAPLSPPLKLHGVFDKNALVAQHRLLAFLIAELDRVEKQLPPLAIAELEQALIVAYLYTNLNNYSDRLNGEKPSLAPWQVRRAAEYIEANWDQPITIEALALVTSSSARSLFASFKKSRGCSPMVFVKRVRLHHARDLLLQGGADVSVTTVALDCGFNNLGHFAKDYFTSFGERPSETLRNGKRRG